MVSVTVALVSNRRLAHQAYEVLAGDLVQQIGHWSFFDPGRFQEAGSVVSFRE